MTINGTSQALTTFVDLQRLLHWNQGLPGIENRLDRGLDKFHKKIYLLNIKVISFERKTLYEKARS
jgi:hypothetical protein